MIKVNNSGNVISFEDCSDFLSWVLKEKNFDFEFEECDTNTQNLYLFLNYYFSIKKNFELKMDSYNESFLKEDNEILKEAMEFFVSSNRGGKYLRAALVSLGYKCFGGNDTDYLPLSMALEIFQTSILIHDDIIDSAVLRRGMDTIPVKYKKKYSKALKENKSFSSKLDNLSNSMAICLGDLGFYLANQIIVNGYYSNPNLSSVLDYYNDIAIKTCKGEMIDVFLPFYEEFFGDYPDLEASILEIGKLKTAWYSVVGPFVLGCVLGGASRDKIKSLEESLIGLGLSYQIKDDLLGIYGDEIVTGKSSFSDVSEFKQTVLYSYTVNTKYKDELLKYYGKDLSLKDLNKVRDIFKNSGAYDYAKKMIDDIFDKSIKKISNLNFLDDEYKKILLGFSEFLRQRSK